MKIFWIDLFSGAGGTTTGIHLAGLENVQVIACVNHDAKAIESHAANHPNCIHYVEDVRNFDVVKKLKSLVTKLRTENPNCYINIWASLECTNFSNAKGGLPRDADSRTLAYALYMYLEELNPDYLYIENVREFLAWGPLDSKGKPVSRLKGEDYEHWRNTIINKGYHYQHQFINAADYGGYSSRIRYFGIFAKDAMPINWPLPTHAKAPGNSGLKKWLPVREVLNLEDEGNSIFTRKKPLVEATLKRIYAGLIKFVAGGEDAFTQVYNSGSDMHRVKSLSVPVGSLTTQNSHSYVTCSFFQKNFSGNPMAQVKDINSPSGSITCVDHHSLVNVKCVFITSYYGNGGGAHSVEKPSPTLTTKDRIATVLIDRQYGTSKPQNSDIPVGAITAVPKFNVIRIRSINDLNKNQYLVNPQFSCAGHSIDKPCFTLIARMDKRPPSVATVEKGNCAIVVYWNDSPMMLKIKEFMALYGIVDIKMRMLQIPELKRIQGFPDNYILKGTKADQKKFIGNAVHTAASRALAESNVSGLIEHLIAV